VSSESIPRFCEEASFVLDWKQAMIEMAALVSRGTWDLVSVPTDVVGCWVYILKFHPDESVD